MLWLPIVLLLACVQALLVDTSGWENVHYYRNVELSRPYVKEFAMVEARNTGAEPQDTYYFYINDGYDAVPDLLFIAVTLVDQKMDLQPFKLNKEAYMLKFPYPVAPNSTVEFKVRYVYSNTLTAFPEKIKMSESQKLLLRLNKFAYSAYPTLEYLIAFTGFNSAQEMDLQLTDVEPTPGLPVFEPRVEERALAYGPLFDTLEPFSVGPMGLLYDHNRPLTRVVNLERSLWLPGSDIDVVQIEEYYELYNNGAELKDGYSRVDWMTGRYDLVRNHFAISQLEFPENPEAPFDNLYFTDKVGKVSSHHPQLGHILMQPRYPLFGGWKYNFTMGWTNKLDNFVHRVTGEEDTYVAQFPLLNGLREIYYDDVYLSFYLPENAELLEASGPFVPEEKTVEYESSYLDVAKGHVKVTLHYKNLIDDLGPLSVYVKYRYTQASYWAKVAKIGGFVFAALGGYYVLALVDLSIEKA